MLDPNINFRNLRIHRTSQNDGFEELTRQIVLADKSFNFERVENRGAGADGGVELLGHLSSGKVWGWQSKFFLDSFGSSEVNQLKKSFTSALNHFANLEKFFVAIPRNLSGAAGGKKNTQRQNWNGFLVWAENEADKMSRTVQLVLWDESYFINRLQKNDPMHAGMRAYWFEDTVFTQDWFKRCFEESLQFLGKRYREDDHIDLDVNKTFQLIRCTPEREERIGNFRSKLDESLKYAQRLTKDLAESVSKPAEIVEERLQKVTSLLSDNHHDELYNNLMHQAVIDIKEINRDLSELSDLYSERFRKKEITEPPENKYVHANSTRDDIRELMECISTAAEIFNGIESRLFKSPCLLVTGEAGMGKSHLLAEEVRQHIDTGGAAWFVPARCISSGDSPKSDILKFIGLESVSFETALAALTAAGLASGKPALIMIDGINESFKAAGWEKSLPILLSIVKRYTNIALIVSVRSAYKKLCIRDKLEIPILEHHGFSNDVGRAAKEYLDRNGIERPSAPIFGMREVLSNPLFLSTAVDALVKLNRTEFPRDLDNISVLIGFWIEAVERNLVDNGFDRITIGDNKTITVIRRIAERMALSGKETLAFDDAHKIAEKVIGLAPPAAAIDRFIQRLIDEGVFIDYPAYDSGDDKFVTFGFQKFNDYFIADHILCKFKTREEFANGLIAGGDFHYLFAEDDYYSYSGIRTALFSLTPVRFKCELPDLRDGFTGEVDLSPEEFISSLTWRSSNSLSNSTLKYLEKFRAKNSDDGQFTLNDHDWYSLLLNLAVLPDCILNAKFLAAELKKLSMPERDASWTAYLVGRGSQYEGDWEAAFQLIDWAWLAPHSSANSDVVELTAISLGLMTSATDRQLRDCASKALASLLVKYPEQTALLVRFFSDWDDPYVRERILAAALCGVLNTDDKQVWRETAIEVDKMVFAKEPVEWHAWTRRYGQFIIEHAHKNGVTLEPNLVSRSSPPYTSKRINEWPTIYDVGVKKDQASSIVHSVVGYMSEPYEETNTGLAGDFGRYTMGGIGSNFSLEQRNGVPPLSYKEQVEKFWRAVSDQGDTVADLTEKLKKIKAEETTSSASQQLQGLVDGYDEITVNITTDEDVKKSKIKLGNAENAFVEVLPIELAKDYQRLKPLNWYPENGIPMFSIQIAQCWVVERCLELGWKKELHEKVERNFSASSYGRHAHHVERIGKKYQHIALQELIGYLADHHWYVQWFDEPVSVLTELESCERADIDISFLAGANSKSTMGYEPGGIAIPKIKFDPESPTSNKKWAMHCDDVPDPTQYFVQKGEDGYDWSIVNMFSRNSDYYELYSSDEPLRSCQYSIELVLVQEKDTAAIVDLDSKSLDGDDRDLFENSWSSAELYGQRQFRHFTKDIDILLNQTVAEIEFTRITDSFAAKASEYDYSGAANEDGFSTPKHSLIKHLKLKPASFWSKLFVNERGEPAFIDNRTGFEEFCVIRSDLLNQFASENGLKPVWRVWVEKDGGKGTKNERGNEAFVRKDYIGFFTKNDKEWKGSLFRYRN